MPAAFWAPESGERGADMDQKTTFRVSAAPHTRTDLTTGAVMYDVILALLPAAVWGIGRFGAHGFLVILTGVLTAVLAEAALQGLAGVDGSVRDGSAAVTGLLLALMLPGDVPIYVPFVGAALAIVLGKGLWGGLGRNLLNPALSGRLLLFLIFRPLFESGMTRTVAGAFSEAIRAFIGGWGGMIGCSAAAVLIGGIYLMAVRRVSWRIPCSVLAGFLLAALILGNGKSIPAFLSGGVVLAAFFLAADPVTSPVTPAGKWIFGAAAGVLCALFGRLMAPGEAVCCGVLLAEIFVPMIDRHTVPRPR